MIHMQGTPHAFFMLTTADLQWSDLRQHMPLEVEVPEGDTCALRKQKQLALNMLEVTISQLELLIL